jgi:hypothetical protein
MNTDTPVGGSDRNYVVRDMGRILLMMAGCADAAFRNGCPMRISPTERHADEIGEKSFILHLWSSSRLLC